MKIRNILLGLAFLASGTANASTVFFPTNQNINFVFTINNGSPGLQLGMFDDANSTFIEGPDYLAIDVGNDTVTFAQTIGQNIDYDVSNNSGFIPNTATLLGSDRFRLGMKDTGLGWADPDAVVCNSTSSSCTVTWAGLSSELVVDMQPIPIPPAVWLFGSGLLGLVGLARRRKTA